MSTRRPVIFFLIVFALSSACWGWRIPDSGTGAAFGEELAGFRGRRAGTGQLPGEAAVGFVSDGDTIILESGEKVRYVGIDAPEIGHGGEPCDCYAQKARKANSAMVSGKKIILRYGPRTRDHYGRLLAWVYLPDGTCINLELVRSGNAWIYKMHGAQSDMFPALLKAQREAMGSRAGLWGACSAKPSPSYFGNRNTYVFHRAECPMGREISPRHGTRFTDRLEAFREGFSPCRVCRP